ncbi:DUF1963 domain-containing protein [Nonlabens sp. SY33080]|uniref:DUF1963 domain-containing protein n=1 Tax=Nonlabens sp. SY33080 TaxID=2719911 RepID=UPI001428B181|nr:YwqG family protein [Nonlabens sp. SY33080]
MRIIKDFFKWIQLRIDSNKTYKIGYILEGHPKTKSDYEKLFAAFNIKDLFNDIIPFVRSGIQIKIGELITQQNFSAHNSQIGGLPFGFDVVKWPVDRSGEKLTFLLKICLEEIIPYDINGEFKKSGYLFFFHSLNDENWGYSQDDKKLFKVIFQEDLCNSSKITKYENFCKPRGYYVNFEQYLSIPEESDLLIEGLVNDDVIDEYSEVSRDSILFGLLGYPDSIQGTMQLDCELYSNGADYDIYNSLSELDREIIKKKSLEWKLLFQFFSDDEKLDIEIGNGGAGYYFIKETDLINNNFEDVWCILQH